MLAPTSSYSGALNISVTASYSVVEAAWRTLFNLDGLVCSLHTAPVGAC